MEQIFAGIAKAEVPDSWRRGTQSGVLQSGRCYRTAAHYVEQHHGDIEGLTLVHGVSHLTVQRDVPLILRIMMPVDHAWAELPGDVVYDGVAQDFFLKDAYYNALHLEMERRYSSGEVLAKLTPGSYDVPWHQPGRFPLFEKLVSLDVPDAWLISMRVDDLQAALAKGEQRRAADDKLRDIGVSKALVKIVLDSVAPEQYQVMATEFESFRLLSAIWGVANCIDTMEGMPPTLYPASIDGLKEYRAALSEKRLALTD